MSLIQLADTAQLISHRTEELKTAYTTPLPSDARLEVAVEREVGTQLLAKLTDCSAFKDELVEPNGLLQNVLFGLWMRHLEVYVLLGTENGIALTDADRYWTCVWDSGRFLEDPVRGAAGAERGCLYLHSGRKMLPLVVTSTIGAYSGAFLRECDDIARTTCEAYKAAARAGAARPTGLPTPSAAPAASR